MSCNSCFDRHDNWYMTEVVCLWKQVAAHYTNCGCLLRVRCKPIFCVIGSGVCRWWVATPVLTDTTTCIWLKLLVCGNRVAAHANCWCLLRVRCKPILCVIWSGVCRWWVATLVLTDMTTCMWLLGLICGNRVAAHTNCWCLLRVRCKPILCVILSGVCRWWVATPALTDMTTCMWLLGLICGNRVAAHYINCWCLLRVRYKPILCVILSGVCRWWVATLVLTDMVTCMWLMGLICENRVAAHYTTVHVC